MSSYRRKLTSSPAYVMTFSLLCALLTLGLLVSSAVVTTPPQEAHARNRFVMCGGFRATVVGTRGSDVLLGTDGSDVISGRRGNDTLIGGKGRDVICGRRGFDTVNGGQGNDRADGGKGGDKCIQVERPRSCESHP